MNNMKKRKLMKEQTFRRHFHFSALRLASCIENAGKGKIAVEGKLETNILIIKVMIMIMIMLAMIMMMMSMMKMGMTRMTLLLHMRMTMILMKMI